jgi:intein/homing endonuclease
MAYTLRKLFAETDHVLETSTDRAPHVGVNLIKRIPDEGEESLTYIAQTRSMVSLVKGKPPKRGFYTTIIRFLDTPDPLHSTPDFDITPVRIRCSCFTPDTLIMLADGKSVPIIDLVGKEEFYVHSYDIEKDFPAIGRAHSCRKTGENVKIIKVVLDNGEEIKCTLDHLFLTKDSRYVEAGNLAIGESLKAVYRRRSNAKSPLLGYKLVSHPKGYSYEHCLADTYNLSAGVYSESDGVIRHHKDFDKNNNCPPNIVRMTKSNHSKLHDEILGEVNRKRLLENNPMKSSIAKAKKVETDRKNGLYEYFRDKMRADNPMFSSEAKSKMIATRRSLGYCDSGRMREQTLKQIKDGKHPFMTEKYKEEQSERMKLGGSWRIKLNKAINIGLSIIKDGCDITEQEYNKRRTNRIEPKYCVVVSKFGEDTFKSMVVGSLNHKVVRIEDCGYSDVYNFEVDKYENFALDVDKGKDCSSGVYVHNCLAFKFYFSYWNLKRGVLEGKPFPPYRRKTTWRPEKNPVHKAGMCKHLFQMAINLAQHGLLEPGQMMAHIRARHHVKKKTRLHPVLHHRRKRGARRV